MPNAATFQLPAAPTTWVMAGDSITQGVLHTYGARCWVEHLHERLRWQLDRFLDVVINSGMSGWTAPQVLEQFDHLIGRYLSLGGPSVVSLSLGTNDCLDGEAGLPRFEPAMRSLVERSQALGAQVILQTPVLVTASGQARRAAQPQYTAAVRQLATDMGCVLIDHEAHWRATFGDAEPIAWMDDHAHPNAVGHAHIAGLLLRELGLGDITQIHQH